MSRLRRWISIPTLLALPSGCASDLPLDGRMRESSGRGSHAWSPFLEDLEK